MRPLAVCTGGSSGTLTGRTRRAATVRLPAAIPMGTPAAYEGPGGGCRAYHYHGTHRVPTPRPGYDQDEVGPTHLAGFTADGVARPAKEPPVASTPNPSRLRHYHSHLDDLRALRASHVAAGNDAKVGNVNRRIQAQLKWIALAEALA